MQSVNIRTAQNVGIRYQLAGLGARMAAFAIDTIVQGVYVIAIAYILVKINLDTTWIWMSLLLPVLFYHLICEITLNGQSIGKKQLNIKVVRVDGSPATLGGYVLRWILRPIDISLFSGGVAVVSIVMSKHGQRLGDMAAGTTVVKVAQEMKVSSHELINNLQIDYKVTFPEVRLLSDSEVNLIKEALAVNKQQANVKPVLAISQKIKSYLGVQSDLPPVKFLYTIIKDYKYVTSQG
ncbi:RDD family protein [Fulvivirga sp. RKSG066]|uniref:RDD family protein n=1 Tax=Fulvivirga aurantia TaxID=2529383 RepID=UPI0012BBBE16|nr:RDD family protein [Fulvivirga aurantia]MTI20969.1 RDD family protein [Fulvivirga aurantia]